RRRARGFIDRRANRNVRHGRVLRIASAPARLARHPFLRDAYQPQRRECLRAFRPARAGPAPGPASALFLIDGVAGGQTLWHSPRAGQLAIVSQTIEPGCARPSPRWRRSFPRLICINVSERWRLIVRPVLQGRPPWLNPECIESAKEM